MAFFADAISSFIVRYNGEFQVGARARFFDAGTNTPRTMYADGDLTTPFDPDDITTDANAQFPPIWGQGGNYKAIITTAGGAVVRTIDNIPGDVEASGGGGGGGGDALPTGFIAPSFLTGTVSGWVRANGKSIGSASSTATERANSDCEALFLALWSNTLLAVSGGRGASAAADWAANKTLALPDGQCAALVGVDAMGATATSLLSGVTFTTGTATAVGSTVGAATQTLTSAQMPSHTHTGTTNTDGAHAHGGTTGGGGSHAHGGTTNAGGSHTHGITLPVLSTSSFCDFGPGAVVANAGSGFYLADTVGDHTHGFTTDVVGNHSHSFTTDAVGGHTHGFTTGSAGSGSAHPNVQPSILVSFYIKL